MTGIIHRLNAWGRSVRINKSLKRITTALIVKMKSFTFEASVLNIGRLASVVHMRMHLHYLADLDDPFASRINVDGIPQTVCKILRHPILKA